MSVSFLIFALLALAAPCFSLKLDEVKTDEQALEYASTYSIGSDEPNIVFKARRILELEIYVKQGKFIKESGKKFVDDIDGFIAKAESLIAELKAIDSSASDFFDQITKIHEKARDIKMDFRAKLKVPFPEFNAWLKENYDN